MGVARFEGESIREEGKDNGKIRFWKSRQGIDSFGSELPGLVELVPAGKGLIQCSDTLGG